jgi:hypothetical protein
MSISDFSIITYLNDIKLPIRKLKKRVDLKDELDIRWKTIRSRSHPGWSNGAVGSLRVEHLFEKGTELPDKPIRVTADPLMSDISAVGITVIISLEADLEIEITDEQAENIFILEELILVACESYKRIHKEYI